MKRRTLRYLVPVAALLAAAGCDYKESFPYQGDELIDFTTDSLYFSFGKEPFSVTEKMMEVGVEIVGSPVSHDRGYRIRIDPLRTTAQAGQHYDALEETRTIPAGASSTTIPVRVHRLELEDETVYTLRLELVETEDFRLGVIEGRAVSVCFTNRLDQPDWWTELSHWLGEYNVRKYQKFIELWGSSITKEDIEENKYAILRVFKEVKLYFEENPVYGVTFPDVEWPV